MTTTALLLALVATAAPVAHVVWIVEDNDAPLFEDELDRVKDALSQSVEQQFPERFVGVRAADERRARSLVGLGGADLGSSDPNAVARVSSSRSSYDEDPSRLSDRAKLLAPCFGKGRKAARFEVRSVLSSTGKPTSTRAAGRDLTDAERACVEKVAGAFSYRCPDAEGDEAAVEFSVWSGP